MTILSWPSGLRNPSSVSGPSLKANTMSGGRSPFDGTEQTLEMPGARWVAELRWNNLPEAQWRILAAFITNLRGQAGRFNWTPAGYMPRRATGAAAPGETIRVRTASQIGNALDTTGWDGLAAPMQTGDFFGFLTPAGRPQLHMVTADVAPTEPTRTNLALNSKVVSFSTSWTKGSATTDEGAVADPEGGTNARRVSSTSAGSNAYVSHTPRITVSPSTQYTLSVYTRLAGGTASGRIFTVDEWNGSVNTRTLGASMAGYTAAWGRPSFTFTTRPDTIGITVYILDAFTVASAAQFDVYGFQVEQGAFPTALIVTTTAPVTRVQSVQIPISPGIRRSPNANEPLILASPPAVWKLGEDMIPIDFTQNGGPRASVTMAIEEAIWG